MNNRHGKAAKMTGTNTAQHHRKAIDEARQAVKSANEHEKDRAHKRRMQASR